jgi:hypothetical protein
MKNYTSATVSKRKPGQPLPNPGDSQINLPEKLIENTNYYICELFRLGLSFRSSRIKDDEIQPHYRNIDDQLYLQYLIENCDIGISGFKYFH